MDLIEKINNIHVIDTNMWGFEHYNSAYIVEGEKIALIDTGEPGQTEAVRSAIKASGFSLSDISYIFITHCEHIDHSGNVAPLLKEAPRATVYIHPLGLKCLTEPDSLNLKARFSPQLMAKRIHSKMESVPESRIKLLRDGEVFDLGNGEELEVIFASGHQPSGIVIHEKKNKGLFISDLVGVCLQDVNVHYAVNPLGSDHLKGIESLKRLMELPVDNLYMGHYGISQDAKGVMAKALRNMQALIEMGTKYMKEGKPELIAKEGFEKLKSELEKLKPTRQGIYDYETQEHAPFQMQLFARYCQERLRT